MSKINWSHFHFFPSKISPKDLTPAVSRPTNDGEIFQDFPKGTLTQIAGPDCRIYTAIKSATNMHLMTFFLANWSKIFIFLSLWLQNNLLNYMHLSGTKSAVNMQKKKYAADCTFPRYSQATFLPFFSKIWSCKSCVNDPQRFSFLLCRDQKWQKKRTLIGVTPRHANWLQVIKMLQQRKNQP